MNFRPVAKNSREAKQLLERGKKYEIPERATHVHVRAGKLSFGFVPDGSLGDFRPKRAQILTLDDGSNVKIFASFRGSKFVDISEIVANGSARFVAFPEFMGGSVIGIPAFLK